MEQLDYEVIIPDIYLIGKCTGSEILLEHINDIKRTDLCDDLLPFELHRETLIELSNTYMYCIKGGKVLDVCNYYIDVKDNDIVNEVYNKRIKSNRLCILPIIKLNDETFNSITKDIDEDETTITLGNYPKRRVYRLKELERLENKYRIYTGNSFTLPTIKPYNKKGEKKYKVSQKKYSEFEVDGKRYIEHKSNNNTTIYEVQPLEWYIDRKRKLLISTDLLLSNIPYIKKGNKEKRELKDSDLYKYLNETFLKEISLTKKNIIVKESHTESDEITILLNEIRLYSMYYHGNEDVEEIILTLLNKYNNDLNELMNNKGLTLYTEEGLYNNLIQTLNTLLDKLKRNTESNIEYHNILEYINECISILNNNKIDTNNELQKDLLSINEIISKLSDKSIKNEIIDIFNKDKIEIENYLSYITTLSNGINLRLEYKTLPYKNIKEYEKYFRIKLQSLLEKLLTISKDEEYKTLIKNREDLLNKISDNKCNKDYINEVLNSIKNHKYLESNSNIKHINTLLETIYKETLLIRKLNKDSVNDIDNILNINIDTDDINEIVDILNNILKSLYRLENDINYEQEKIKRLNKYKYIV